MAELNAERHSPRRCSLPHDPLTGLPKLRISYLMPSLNPQTLPKLLGLKNDIELLDQMGTAHPYAFNMGGSNIFPLHDFERAGKHLMMRNMPDVLLDRQTGPVFVPETYLPTMPRVIDLERFETRKKRLNRIGKCEGPALGLKRDKVDKTDISKQRGTVEITQVKGDLAEKKLGDALRKFYEASDQEVVVFQGPKLRIPGKDKGSAQESDIVIINKTIKTVFVIESKATLTGKCGLNAVIQTQKVKDILEEFFATELASKDWRFVGMIYTNEINKKMHFCADCSQFVAKGPHEFTAKLNDVQLRLKALRPQEVVRNHTEYVSLVQGLAFVVLSKPISTCCTIANDVFDKVVGIPEIKENKETGACRKEAKAGQGDFQSIIFWTNEQANIMLMEMQFVFFASPWSTGKTICMRERAAMWARENHTQKLYFVVIRNKKAKLTSLLEMELKDFFHHQHNLQNVEVLGLPATPQQVMHNLLREATERFPGSWFVDELIMPGSIMPEEMEGSHSIWSSRLDQLQSHVKELNAVLSGNPPLWISCAGVIGGEAKHFEKSYLTKVLPDEFHIPEMQIPLRNTKSTLALAKLDKNTSVKGLYAAEGPFAQTKPVYDIPDLLMEGLGGKEFVIKTWENDDEATHVVETACINVLQRTGGQGFPVLCNAPDFDDNLRDGIEWRMSQVKRGLERATGVEALIYHQDPDRGFAKKYCTEAEVKKWSSNRRNMQERRCLITDHHASRGWEASHAIVVAFSSDGLENLIMRTVGYCALVKEAGLSYSNFFEGTFDFDAEEVCDFHGSNDDIALKQGHSLDEENDAEIEEANFYNCI